MDAIDILGSLLGRSSAGANSGGGGNILKDMLGGRKSQPSQRQAPPQSSPSRRRPTSIDGAAKSLEDLLNVSHHTPTQQPSPAGVAPSAPSPRPPTPQRSPYQPTPPRSPYQQAPRREALNEQSTLLIRAMINAAKSDGQISQEEQDGVVGQLGNLTQQDVQFLREEFARPLDVKEFCWSVPQGLEEQVYTVSLMAIKLDANAEAQYLGDLAHGLRLSPERCNEIHRQHGAPEIHS